MRLFLFYSTPHAKKQDQTSPVMYICMSPLSPRQSVPDRPCKTPRVVRQGAYGAFEMWGPYVCHGSTSE